MSARCRPLLFAALLCLTFAAPARAVITVLIPLKQAIDGQDVLFTAKIKDVLPDKPAIVLEAAEFLKGDKLKAGYQRLPILLVGDSEAKKGDHPKILLERFAKDQTVIVFVKARGKRQDAFIYSDGTWCSIQGQLAGDGDAASFRWSLLHAEPYLRRTFKGTTAEMEQAIRDHLAGKKEPPAPDIKEAPGFGPIPMKKTGKLDRPAAGRTDTLFGVIQLPFLGLIAALAALFPAVFGGMAIFMKRWVAVLSVSSAISMIFAVAIFFPRWLASIGLGSVDAQWWLSSAIALGGIVWAVRRYRTSLLTGNSDAMQPRGADRWALLALLMIGGGGIGYALSIRDPLLVSPWLELLVAIVPLTVGTVYAWTACCFRQPAVDGSTILPFSVETAMLAGLLLATSQAGTIEAMQRVTTSAPKTIEGAARWSLAWGYQPDEAGAFLSTPAADGKQIFVAAHHSGLRPYGKLYSLDATTGKVAWEFDADGDLKSIFSSAALTADRLYLGDGFHQDSECKLYCVDRKTGKEVWNVPTKSHVESPPQLANGLVVFGAGNDGLYAVDAETGKVRWHVEGYHIDSRPAIAGGKVFVGCGASRSNPRKMLLAFDLVSGKELWKESVELSAYASPLAADGFVYFGLGNGTYSEDRDSAGMVVCRNQADGKPVWTRPLPKTPVAAPCLFEGTLAVTCRDGKLYALDSATGEAKWDAKIDDTPLLASPIVYRLGEQPMFVAVSEAGVVGIVEPSTGKVVQSLSLKEISGLPRVMVTATPVPLPGEQKGLLFAFAAHRSANDGGSPRVISLVQE